MNINSLPNIIKINTPKNKQTPYIQNNTKKPQKLNTLNIQNKLNKQYTKQKSKITQPNISLNKINTNTQFQKPII